jgi:hypothetical protein
MRAPDECGGGHMSLEPGKNKQEEAEDEMEISSRLMADSNRA